MTKIRNKKTGLEITGKLTDVSERLIVLTIMGSTVVNTFLHAEWDVIEDAPTKYGLYVPIKREDTPYSNSRVLRLDRYGWSFVGAGSEREADRLAKKWHAEGILKRLVVEEANHG